MTEWPRPRKGGPFVVRRRGATGYWMVGRSPESRCEPTSPCTYLTLHLLTFPQSRGGSDCRTDIRLGFQEHARCDAGSNGLARCPSEVSQADPLTKTMSAVAQAAADTSCRSAIGTMDRRPNMTCLLYTSPSP